MKVSSILITISILLSYACEKDNYKAPQSQLTGRIVYNGNPIPVSYDDVTFEIYEPGWQLKTPLTAYVAQDGSYSMMLFDGDYQLSFRPNQGPFHIPFDTLAVAVKGRTELDIEVIPYYLLNNPVFDVDGNAISATVEIERVTHAPHRNIERVSLYVGTTNFVDGRTSVSTATIDGNSIDAGETVNLQTAVPTLTHHQDYLFVRVGLKIADVEDMLFTQVEKIQIP